MQNNLGVSLTVTVTLRLDALFKLGVQLTTEKGGSLNGHNLLDISDNEYIDCESNTAADEDDVESPMITLEHEARRQLEEKTGTRAFDKKMKCFA